MCRVLAVILAVSDNPRSGAGRVGLLLGGAIEALMPCLGLPKPEVIRSALEVCVCWVSGGEGVQVVGVVLGLRQECCSRITRLWRSPVLSAAFGSVRLLAACMSADNN